MPRSQTRRQNKRKGTRKQLGGATCGIWCPYSSQKKGQKPKDSDWYHDYNDWIDIRNKQGKIVDRVRYCDKCGCADYKSSHRN